MDITIAVRTKIARGNYQQRKWIFKTFLSLIIEVLPATEMANDE